MAGCVAFGRSVLWRHPSFWAEEEAEQLPEQVVEDPRVINGEAHVFAAIAAQTTPFVACLDEATINVGCFTSEGPKEDCFKRVVAAGSGQMSGFTWEQRRQAYVNLNKMHLGHECLISEEDPEGAERRINRRLQIGRLEACPPVRATLAPNAGGNSLFEAFSTALWATPAYHLPLRQLVVDFMAQCPEEYATFLGNNFDAYLKFMRQPGVSGDELVLRALADRFGLPITVVTGDEVIWCIRYPPRHTVSQREVFLAVAPVAQFSAVRRQSAMTTLKLTLAGGQEAKTARALRKKLVAYANATEHV